MVSADDQVAYTTLYENEKWLFAACEAIASDCYVMHQPKQTSISQAEAEALYIFSPSRLLHELTTPFLNHRIKWPNN